MNEFLVIGLSGSAGCGKTTASESIRKYGYKRMAFADPVKEIAKLFGWDGKKDKRGRRLLQLIGTEIGRWYNPNIWLHKMDDKISDYQKLQNSRNQSTLIVIEDARFNNEANYIHKHNGINIRITGNSYYEKTIWGRIRKFFGLTHRSERGINQKYIDYTVNMPDFKGNTVAFSEYFQREFTKILAKETYKRRQ